MNFPFPTLQEGMANTAFEIQAPMMQKRLEQNKLMLQDMQMQQGLARMQAPMPQQEGQGRFVQPPAFAQGGIIMPGGMAPAAPALNDPTAGPAGMVWDATLQRWVPKRASKVMGTTNWDVKNFGKYSGFGTSQGGIGRVQPTGLAPVVTPAPAAPVPAGTSAMRMPGRGMGVLAPAPAPMSPRMPSPAMNNFPGSGVLKPLSPDRGPLRQYAMEQQQQAPSRPAPPDLYQGFQPPAFARGGVMIPVPAWGAEGGGVPMPYIVGDEPQPSAAMTAPNRVVTSGLPNSMSDRYGSGSATRPEIVVTPTRVEVAGTNGPEMRTATEPTVIMPNPRTVQENLQQIAVPAPTGIGANYQPNQPGLRWTGSGFASAPSGPRKTDIRRALRTPQAVMMLMNQQADQQRLARDDARFARNEQSQANAQSQAKADKAAEEAAADARLNSMLDALSSEKSILSPTQRATLGKIKGVKERQSALEVFMRANETEAEQAAQRAEKAAAAQYRYEDVPGAPYLLIKDGTGKVIQTLTKDKPDAKPVPVPEGMEPVSMDSAGRVTYQKIKPAGAPDVQTVYQNGIAKSVMWDPNRRTMVEVQVGAAGQPAIPTPAGQAVAPAAASKAELDRYFKR